MSDLAKFGQEISLVDGDTNNPFHLYIHGIGSEESATKHLRRVLNQQQSLPDFLVEVEEFMNEVDSGTNELVRMYPNCHIAHDLAVQWAILAANPIHNNFQTILHALKQRANSYRTWEPVRAATELFDLYIRAAILYDIFLTRMMTQVRSGGHGVREMLQSLKPTEE
jgi:hypothetical protein